MSVNRATRLVFAQTFPQFDCTWTYTATVASPRSPPITYAATVTSDSSVDCSICDQVTATTTTVLEALDAIPFSFPWIVSHGLPILLLFFLLCSNLAR